MNKIALSYAILCLMMNQLVMVRSYREHKVHNIVLYPDKHSWCKTTVIKQVISYPGCSSVEINNNVCVGACFSYSIPQTEPSDPGEVIVPYCDSCQPSETTWHQITLQCNIETQQQLIKNVQIIQNCSCTPCEKDSLRITKSPNNKDDLSLQTNVDSEILNALHLGNDSNVNHHVDNDHWKKKHSLLNQEIVNILKNIQKNNTDQDKEKLFELFNIIQEPNKHRVRTKDIIDYIETLPKNVTHLDTELLAVILLKYEKNQKSKAHDRSFEAIDDTTTDDIDQPSSPLNVAIPIWMHSTFSGRPEQNDDDSVNSMNANDDVVPINEHSSLSSSSSSSSHRVHEHRQQHNENFDGEAAAAAAASAPLTGQQVKHQAEPNDDNPRIEEEDEVKHHHTQHTHNHQHHHVNDNIAAHAHLARGPHGALVIEPDRIHEKLVDVNAHELKPNHAGTLLSYHSHSSENDSQK